MNSDETWLLYLFSGTFAGIISGGVAALVAMLVLRKSSAHQTTLATDEADRQEARATSALAQQRNALKKQLHEQRQEAALAREVGIRSELLELTSNFGTLIGQDRPEDIRETDRQISVKLHQWMINLMTVDDVQLRSELSQWGGLLSDLELVAAQGDPGGNGRIYLGQALEAMQRVATNYRLTWSSVIWNSRYCAELMSAARKNLQGYLLGQDEAVDNTYLWGDELRKPVSGSEASNPSPEVQKDLRTDLEK